MGWCFKLSCLYRFKEVSKRSIYNFDNLSEHTSKTVIPEATPCHRSHSEHVPKRVLLVFVQKSKLLLKYNLKAGYKASNT